MLTGFQGGTGLFRGGKLAHSSRTMWMWVASGILLAWFWHGSRPVSVQGWWMGAGVLLILKASFDIRRQQRQIRTLTTEWLEPFEAMGTILMLMVGSGQVAAVVAGFLSGFLLPVALQDWMRPADDLLTVLRTAAVGAVGLEDVSAALFPGHLSWTPKILWMVPWLVWWEFSDWLWRDSSIAWRPKQSRE